MSLEHSLGQALDEIALELPDLPDLHAALERVAELAHRLVPGCTGASVTVERNGSAFTVAASDERVLDLDDGQYATGTGPCLTALRTMRVTAVDDLVTEDRWPAFTALARGAGVSSMLSVPLSSTPPSMGVLNLYSDQLATLTVEGRSVAETIATFAGAVMRSAQLYFDARALSRQLQEAMTNRAVIEQAKGVLMVESHVDDRAAFALLSSMSQRRNRKLREIAAEIVAHVSTGLPGSPLDDTAV